MSGPFLNANRNKRSIALDLKQASAKAALRELIASADVLFAQHAACRHRAARLRLRRRAQDQAGDHLLRRLWIFATRLKKGLAGL